MDKNDFKRMVFSAALTHEGHTALAEHAAIKFTLDLFLEIVELRLLPRGHGISDTPWMTLRRHADKGQLYGVSKTPPPALLPLAKALMANEVYYLFVIVDGTILRQPDYSLTPEEAKKQDEAEIQRSMLYGKFP